jgi:hypothetical protein
LALASTRETVKRTADDAADHGGDELRRRVAGLPLHLVRALLLRGEFGDVAQQPGAILDDSARP